MDTLLLMISGLFTLLLAYLLIRNKINTTFKKMAFTYNLLFFCLFSFLLVDHIPYDTLIDRLQSLVHKYQNMEHVHAIETMVSHENTTVTAPIKDSVLLDAPIISQYPELPRGCEVTSLAMLLQYTGVNVDKMTLAKEIKKDPTPYKVRNKVIYFGNPNTGFVGDMYTKKNKGFGVYHGPVAELATQFSPIPIIDITGTSFDNVLQYLSNGNPVWVITNVKYKQLPDSYFETWKTPTGIIKITYQEHSVLVTGYDDEYIYFNDPLTGTKNKKAPRKQFIESWIQMGRQAITYVN
ncbi:C39 family peptidase [Bacillus timonensis]|nr:C39 family peptidase [Bacillus timonensis]